MRGQRTRQVAVWGLALVLLATVILAANTLRSYAGLFTADRTPAELSALLSPYYVTHLPDGAGPFPTALLLSGCDGPHDNLDRLAERLNADGWAALIVNSHAPRGLDQNNFWRLVCSGQILPGAERAGDVAVALEDARRMEFVDSDRMILIGASHGGWAILDLLAVLGQGATPPGLTDWPVPAPAVMVGVQAAVLFYPYCGIGSQVRRHGWQADLPMLFLLVEDDSVADESACLRVIERATAQGLPVETVMFPGTTHGFDQSDKALFSPLEFDPDTTERALGIVAEFMSRQAG